MLMQPRNLCFIAISSLKCHFFTQNRLYVHCTWIVLFVTLWAITTMQLEQSECLLTSSDDDCVEKTNILYNFNMISFLHFVANIDRSVGAKKHYSKDKHQKNMTNTVAARSMHLEARKTALKNCREKSVKIGLCHQPSDFFYQGPKLSDFVILSLLFHPA